MSDKPEAAKGAEAPASATPGQYPELMHLAEAVKMIEDRRTVAFSTNDVERQKFLKQLKRGDFPPPSKPTPTQKLPKVGHGDIDWAECWWAREDIELWLGGQTSAEKWEQRWAQFPNVKPWRDWPSLASYAARRVVKGEGEWEHWADRYRPRAFTGKVIFYLLVAGVVGYLCFGLIPQLDQPLWERDDKGAPVLWNNIYKTIDGKRAYQEAVNVDGSPSRWIQLESGQPIAEGQIAKNPDGTFAKAEKIQYKRAASKEKGKPGPYVNAEGNPIVFADASEPAMVKALAENGRPEKSAFAFLAADLSGVLFPGATVPLVAFLIAIGIPGLLLLYRFCYNWLSLSYTLTDSRLIVREGLLARHESQVRVIQITDLSVSQDLLQVMLGVGNIVVHSDDVDTPELEILGIRDPRAVKDRIFQVSEVAKQEKRYYVEAAGSRHGAHGGHGASGKG